MVGLALVCAYLAKTIPELVAGMISGTSMGGGSAIGGMAAAGAAVQRQLLQPSPRPGRLLRRRPVPRRGR